MYVSGTVGGPIQKQKSPTRNMPKIIVVKTVKVGDPLYSFKLLFKVLFHDTNMMVNIEILVFFHSFNKNHPIYMVLTVTHCFCFIVNLSLFQELWAIFSPLKHNFWKLFRKRLFFTCLKFKQSAGGFSVTRYDYTGA